MTRKRKLQDLTQQELLRLAMAELGMTRAQFAARICVPGRTLDKWLLPSDSHDANPMPAMGISYVRDLLEWHRKST
ncbi:transcriptional regulator (plasmid) [Burkholderia sp. MS455]|uniref:transcriptional regulator n=1 Tax=Burkholderia sp. MS455 TaxID=2811788 RepID=UPI0019598BF3|nr:transcriptional regulator [Burkholderia sp. MS455]QRR11821.1 transcriptional regulator [Burkholderia sp. MS455]